MYHRYEVQFLRQSYILLRPLQTASAHGMFLPFGYACDIESCSRFCPWHFRLEAKPFGNIPLPLDYRGGAHRFFQQDKDTGLSGHRNLLYRNIS